MSTIFQGIITAYWERFFNSYAVTAILLLAVINQFIQEVTMFETLDTMIALAVVYLILSMINKFILSGFKRILRVKFIVMAGELKDFTSSGLVKYLQDLNTPNASPKFVIEGLENLSSINRKSIQTMTEVKGCVEAFLKKESVEDIAGYLDIDLTVTGQELAKAKARAIMVRDRLEAAYNSTMERISERYTAWMRYIAMGVGLIIACGMNADFFVIYKSVTENATVRAELVSGAADINEKMKTMLAKIEGSEGKSAAEGVKGIYADIEGDIVDLKAQLDNKGLKLGWQHEQWKGYAEGKKCTWLINKIIGLVASAFLIGFGAPFWHDLLTSLMGIKKVLRGKGEKSEGTTPKIE